MKFKELYEKRLDRKVNPAVSASDLSEETVNTEIEEYVFTQEIIAYLYNILTNIRSNQGSHIGIWINGYYGSGKSHFLKYASYCLSPKYAERAFDRLIEATKELINNEDPLALLQANVELPKLMELRKWYMEKAHVEMIMFNIGEVHDVNADQKTAFTKIFWNQFNAKRGFNSFNLALAQHLEKALYDNGKFEDFKDYVKSKGFNWEKNITRFAGGSLNKALEMAHEVDPNLTIDAIRERIIKNDVNVSVESFANELKEYLDSKEDENYRILFFVDEVSQFVGEHHDLLLQLQSLVELLYEKCESRVWIACTAQQSLEEVVSDMGGKPTDPNDEIGKILGRFEVRASLQGTSPEYITRRRILEKNGSAELELGNMYQANKKMLDAQFILPTTYQSYNNKEDFIGYYPFVPYQFQLIMRVLDSFVSMNYVDRQVKGNERSMLNITFSIAKETAEFAVGEFIPFDRFFGAMFQGSMQHLGRRAIANAQQAIERIEESKRKFYERVVNILFMICNLADQDKPSFSATIDNVVTLLMTKVDANRGAIKNDVEQVLSYLMDNSVIRKEKTKNGTEIYEFYTEEETQVAEIIKNQKVDNNTYSEELYKIIYEYLGLSNKETYATRSFNIGCNVNDRHYLSSNADVVVDFLTSSAVDIPEQYTLSNRADHLVFFLTQMWSKDRDLRQRFLNYCRVQSYAQQASNSEKLQETKKKFQDRAKQEYDKEIKPKLQQILDTCSIISGQSVLSATDVGISKGRERYKKVMGCHMERLYEFAQVVDIPEVPKNQNDLRSKITRPIEPSLVETPLSVAEQRMKDYLDRQSHDVTVDDVVKYFTKVPYGWSDIASIYTLNELVRRHLYAYTYNNDPNVQREFVAQNIVREASKFTVEKAKAISQDVLNKFIEAWKHIFNEMSVPGGNDSTELYRACNESEDSVLRKRHKEYDTLLRKLGVQPFVEKMNEAVELMEAWLAIKDHKKFFETIIEANANANTANLFDYCKNITNFVKDQYDKYEDIVRFVNDNKDNFSFLPADQRSPIDSVRAIKTDKEPWDNMPAYIKLRRELDNKLQSTKNNLVENIKAKYNQVFDELDNYAKNVGVTAEKYANREQTIAQKIGTNNFHALRDATDVSAFRDEQYEKINSAIETSEQPSKAPIRRRKTITLNTRTTTPLHTEDDVDAYLQCLKKEIMQHIGGNEDILIN